jgi:hypothetical protein
VLTCQLDVADQKHSRGTQGYGSAASGGTDLADLRGRVAGR